MDLLAAVDKLDIDQVLGLCAPDCRFTTVDGRHAEGRAATRQLLVEYFADVRSTTHQITAQWHDGDVWFAEVLATYELKDRLKIDGLPRAFLVRTGVDGIRDLRVYGANEHPLGEHRSGEEPFRIGGRLVLPL
ncbi:MAG TPA: nuclear transport factor 2 family protein [Acidimicrobiales bacterium]|nr:nuclear transport factor 2 family protein [Acidimicrobiales bacterium]